MTTYVRADEAARILGVSKPTLYAYVSRGRVSRITAPDGRASLFVLDEIEALAARGRKTSPAERPTIDVQVVSAITTLSEDGVSYRGHPLEELAERYHFEQVAELLWTGSIPDDPPDDIGWPGPDDAVVRSVGALGSSVHAATRLAIASNLLADRHPGDDPATAARRILATALPVLGARRATGAYAARLSSCWVRRPDPALVTAIDRALVVLADHELATSTLAVRIAASARTSAQRAIAAGLASIDGALHGSAASLAHVFLSECAERGPDAAVRERRGRGELIPGFGHKIYRRVDPRFELLMESVLRTATPEQCELIDEVIRRVGNLVPRQPNVDLALGALTWTAGIDPDVPLFTVARIAGWAAHCAEEFEAPPLRYRGLARRPADPTRIRLP